MAKEADFRWVDKNISIDDILKDTASSLTRLAETEKETAIKIIGNYIEK